MPSPVASSRPWPPERMQSSAEPPRTCPIGSRPSTYTSFRTHTRTFESSNSFHKTTSSSSFPDLKLSMSPPCADDMLKPSTLRIPRDKPSLGPSQTRLQASLPHSSRHLPPELDLLQIAMQELDLPEPRAVSPQLRPSPEEPLDAVLGPRQDIVLRVNGVKHRAYVQDVLFAELHIPAAISSNAAST